MAGRRREPGATVDTCAARTVRFLLLGLTGRHGRARVVTVQRMRPGVSVYASKSVTQSLISVVLLRYQQVLFPLSSPFPVEKMTQICGLLQGGVCLCMCVS